MTAEEAPSNAALASACAALSAQIQGIGMGRREWLVMNRDESAFCICFSYRHSANPAREAASWLDEKRRSSPGWVEANGYHVVERLFFTEVETLALEAAKLLSGASGALVALEGSAKAA